jgi:hypothetical protein
VADLEILEDGDESEIGERGVCTIVWNANAYGLMILDLGQLIWWSEGSW